jgi:hypothetical protein
MLLPLLPVFGCKSPLTTGRKTRMGMRTRRRCPWRFPVDGAASDDDDKGDDGEGDKITFEAQHLLAGGQYVAVAEESSSSPRLMEW